MLADCHDEHHKLVLETVLIDVNLRDLGFELPDVHVCGVSLGLDLLLVVVELSVDLVELVCEFLILFYQVLEALFLVLDPLWTVDDFELSLELIYRVVDDLPDVFDLGRAIGQQFQMSPQLIEQLLAELGPLVHLMQIVGDILTIEQLLELIPCDNVVGSKPVLLEHRQDLIFAGNLNLVEGCSTLVLLEVLADCQGTVVGREHWLGC